jgi:hypothetical protein
MAYYLGKERDEDCAGSYQRYQAYLLSHQQEFPVGAFALGTARWWQDGNNHRSPHDSWLESVTIFEPSSRENFEERITAMRVRLMGAYHDGFIELFYPRVFRYSFQIPVCVRGMGDWRYDEFRLSPNGHVIHEIEWAGFPHTEGSRWIIEASDIEYQWIPN